MIDLGARLSAFAVLSGRLSPEDLDTAINRYLETLIEAMPMEMVEAAALPMRNGHPHDGSELDRAVAEDARAALVGAFSALRGGGGQ